MKTISVSLRYRSLATLALAMAAVDLFLLAPVFFHSELPDLSDFGHSQYGKIVARSLIFGFVASFSAVILSVMLSFLFRNMREASYEGRLLAVLLMPLFLGDASTAYIFKSMLGQGSLIAELVAQGPVGVFPVVLVLQLWRFVPFCTYLLWLRIRAISHERMDYATSVGMSNWEVFRLVILPEVRPVAILLSLLVFAGSALEDTKLRYIFKASPGTETELVSHWLSRTFQSDLVFSPDQAMSRLFSKSAFASACLLFGFLFISIAMNAVMRALATSRFSIGRRPNPPSRRVIALSVQGAMISAVVLPMILPFAQLVQVRAFSDFRVIYTLSFVVAGAAIAVSLAVVFGLFLRLSQFARPTLAYPGKLSLVVVWFILLMPPLSIMIAIFKWLSIIGYRSGLQLHVAWIIGQTLLSLPILGSFIFASHLRVGASELEFLGGQGVGLASIVRLSFFGRFWREYILTFVVGVSMLWNESVLNRVLSDVVPSFVSNLEMSMVGRAAEASLAFSYYLLACALAVSCSVGWLFVLAHWRRLGEA